MVKSAGLVEIKESYSICTLYDIRVQINKAGGAWCIIGVPQQFDPRAAEVRTPLCKPQ